MKRKVLSLVLAICMVLSVVAVLSSCRDKKTTTTTTTSSTTSSSTSAGPTYDEISAAIYDAVLGEFYEIYTAAKEATSVSERQALMALAEAKLLASGVMLPLGSNGGNYAVSAVVPYTATSTLWGNDSYRYHNLIIANSPLKAAERDELKAKWNELKGTGTWEAFAKNYLTQKGYSIKNTYNLGYSSDPQTWDVLATSMAADSEAIVNTYDGLFEYNNENVLSPALAVDYEVSEDGTVYTFTIRQGVKWVDSQGREIAEVKADDFVAGMQHMMDSNGDLGYLVEGIIVNATEYMKGEVDFDEVGVKAVGDYTLQYTLVKDTSFFMTMLGYGVFAPMNRAYYISQGGQFGADYDDSAATYTYGKTPDNIAYCGPYLVSSMTAENSIVFSANPTYWNKDNINIQTITWLFNDGEDALKAYNDMKDGLIDGCGLNASALEVAKTDTLNGANVFDVYTYVSSCDATSFMAFVNLNREAYANYNDGTTAASPKTDDQKARAEAAMLNKNFRLALAMAVDRGAYNAQVVGEELKFTSLRNTYTPGNFVSLTEEVTIEINGVATTYAAGTWYGKIMQDQLNADGVNITVWDPEAEGGAGSSDGFDGWYNPTEAAAQLAIAIEALAAEGIVINAQNPIYLDLPTYTGSDVYRNRSNAYKQSVEAALGGAVIINIVECPKAADWYYAGYYPPTGAESNYDICDVSGWGPDYGDPQSYLDTMLPDYAGYMTKALGIF